MLVLTRKRGESVMVGSGADVVEVVIVEQRGDKVRIGFLAPKEVPIHRKEVFDVIHGKEPAKPDGISWDKWNNLPPRGKVDMVERMAGSNVQEGETE